MLSREATLERERRWRIPAAISAILVPILFIPQRVIANGIAGPPGGSYTDQLPFLDANSSEFVLSQVLRALAFVAMIAPLVYLFMAARARSDRVSLALIAFLFIGPILFAAQSLLGAFAQVDFAERFVADAGRGGDVFDLASSFSSSSGLASTAGTLLVPAVFGLMIAVIYVPLQAMRTGLLTRFSATFAMALGASILILGMFLGPEIPLTFITLWFLFVGLMLLGVARRPPAWAAGVAIPWPKPGEEARPVEEPASPEEFGGSSADEEPDTGPAVNPNAARRERAKRKRRKQRRS